MRCFPDCVLKPLSVEQWEVDLKVVVVPKVGWRGLHESLLSAFILSVYGPWILLLVYSS